MLRTALVGTTIVLLGTTASPESQTTSSVASSLQWTDDASVVVPKATQYGLRSRVNGRVYRIMVSTPFSFDPAEAYPVLYTLDANTFFSTVTEVARLQSFGKVQAPAIVVGIAYDTDDLNEWARLRRFDMTPTPSRRPEEAGQYGGGDAFLRVIEEEVKPFITSRYRIDQSKQVVLGASLGGLIALRGLFRNPTAFATYVLVSPSIWWDEKAVLADEATFAKRARSGEFQLTVILTSGRDEQYHGSDPKLLAEAQSGSRMVDNASELAARLAALNPVRLKVVRALFDDEVHNSVFPAAISRGLRLALPLK